MNISLRPFTQTDIETCRQWARDIHADRYQSRIFPRAFNGRDLSGGVWAWYIIVVDGEDAGTVWLEKESPEEEKAILGIMLGKTELFGRGIGREAVRQAMEQARDSLGFRRVVLTVRRDNARAITSYKHAGFVISGGGIKTREDGTGIPFHVMELDLAEK
jgi:RimJ/RimL family protein N-acetyltransferase